MNRNLTAIRNTAPVPSGSRVRCVTPGTWFVSNAAVIGLRCQITIFFNVKEITKLLLFPLILFG